MTALYARYDGPLPRQQTQTTGPACREALLRDLFRAIRLTRKNGQTDLRALTDLAGEMRKKYERTI